MYIFTNGSDNNWSHLLGSFLLCFELALLLFILLLLPLVFFLLLPLFFFPFLLRFLPLLPLGLLALPLFLALSKNLRLPCACSFEVPTEVFQNDPEDGPVLKERRCSKYWEWIWDWVSIRGTEPCWTNIFIHCMYNMIYVYMHTPARCGRGSWFDYI